MNLLDLLILVLVAGAVAHGLWLGAAIQALSLGGFVVGMVAGAGLAPLAARLASDPAAKAALSLGVLFAVAGLVGSFGRVVGVRVWGRIRRRGLAGLDAALGAVGSAAVTLLGCWLVGSMLATAPVVTLATEVQQSAILRTLDAVLPPAPSVFSRLQRLIEPEGFPQVFAQLEPHPAPGLPLPGDPVVRGAVAAARAATVKVVGFGCGGVQEGSGFVAAPDLVVTNAHVVAGIGAPIVIDGAGRHTTTPVLFDPRLDVAVLRAPLSERPLSLGPGSVARGTEGAVLGYPGGGPFDAEPAVVAARYQAIGRDIYSEGLTSRAVYELRSRVRPGNSGGPLVAGTGTVVGVVFSRSSYDQSVGYALTSDEVVPALRRATSSAARVDTGPCAAE
ncbi:MAG TPA: MarP family serine protease [Acidimicrobiales bacterium]|nr:MarP family serine protease [Acidimicrobiales bacterium]